MDELADGFRPRQGTGAGVVQGRRLTSVGRLQYRYAQGNWTEWQALLDDCRAALLSEDNGAYVFSLPARLAREVPADENLVVGATTALDGGELIKAIRFPIPKKAVYEKLRQSASHFPLVGVFIAQYDNGVRVAVTGASNGGVYRHKGLEEALTRSFTADAASKVKIDAGDLNSDLHATAAYRANLVSVLAQRGIASLTNR